MKMKNAEWNDKTIFEKLDRQIKDSNTKISQA